MGEQSYSSWLLERIAIGDVVRLRLGISTLGRHSSSTIRVLSSKYASRHHAEITVSNNDTVTIKDLNSCNGIFINETLHNSDTVNLRNGDQIGIGVSTDGAEDEDLLQLPIYVLKYAPIIRGRRQQPPPPPRIVQDVVLTQPTKKLVLKEEDDKPSCSKDVNEGNSVSSCTKDINKGNSGEDNKPSCNKDINKGNSGEDVEPSCSKDLNKKDSLETPKPHLKISDEIFVISDDDDDEAQKKEEMQAPIANEKKVINKPQPIEDKEKLEKSNENSKDVIHIPQQMDVIIIDVKNEKIDQQDAVLSSLMAQNSNLNHDFADEIGRTPDDPDYISPSQITKNTNTKEKIDQQDALLSSLICQNSNLNHDFADQIASTPDDPDYINPSQITKNTNTKEKIDQQDLLSSLMSQNSNLNHDFADEIARTPDNPEYINPSQITKNTNQDNLNKVKEQPEKDLVGELEENENDLHVPILSSVKKERIRSVSADIQNIFGDMDKDDDDVVKNKLKEINPLVYNQINNQPLIPATNVDKALHNGDFITLTDDEEEELGTIVPISNETKEKETSALEIIKSPNIFETSLNDSKEECAVDNSIKHIDNLKDNLKEKKLPVDNIDIDEYCAYEPQSDDEDIEDLMFSQVFINDMKAELQDDIDEEQDFPQPDQDLPQSTVVAEEGIYIKQEPGTEIQSLSLVPKELENSCWIISDDEDYDEELETKVNDWSNKIFSQSFNNMSQVYDLNEDDHNDDEDDEEGELIMQEDDIDNIADFYNSNSVMDPTKERENEQETDVNDIFLAFDNKLKNLNEIQTAKEKFLETEETSNENKQQQKENVCKTIDSNQKEKTSNENVLKISNENLLDKNSVPNEKDIESLKPNEKSHNIPNNNEEYSKLADSPVIRRRSLNKNRPVVTSSSSSEDEQDIEQDQIKNIPKTKENRSKPTNEEAFNNNASSAQEKPISTTTRLPPTVIEAPRLPKHRGKLRGVSAEPRKNSTISTNHHHKTPKSTILKTLSSTKEKIQQERYNKDLKRKWLEKPSLAAKRDKEHTKYIKETIKVKLKELTEKGKSTTKENIHKRKLSAENPEHKSKKAKVKVTTHNRQAFLAENNPKLPPPPPPHKTDTTNQFKIPKIVNKKPEINTKEHELKGTISSSKDPTRNGIISHPKDVKRSNSLDCMETFSQQITKPDELLLKKQHADPSKSRSTIPTNSTVPPLRRHSTTEQPKQTKQCANDFIFLKPANHPPICKESIAARAVRTTNKITFASMEKNIIESEENKRKLSELSSDTTSVNCHLESSLTKLSTPKKKKTVRFIDAPVIHYIERVSGACRRVVHKDIMPLTTNKDRQHLVRQTYPIIDCTDTIISKILSWSNEWLIKRNAAAEAASDILYPMPQQFNSFDHYKSIILPLMKLEFVSLMEREFNSTFSIKNFKVTLEYVTENKDRFVLVTKLNNPSRDIQDSSLYDFVLLECDKKGPKMFAHVTSTRKGMGSTITIVYEIIAKNFTKEYFKAIKELNVRPVIDKVRVNFGAFNAVFQLEATPLFHKIMNPLELLKCKPPAKKKIVYRGCDQLNDKQKQVLLHTYVKIIDETTPNITLLQGPPGTGKSCVITNLALQTLYGDEVRYLDKKILICAQSNAAVDVIAGKLLGISLKMRAEIRFRLIRYGVLNKIHPKVLPIALQKLVEHDQLKKLKAKNKNIQLENKENLRNQILQLEAQIADLSSRNIKGTFEEDGLLEKQKQLTLMRNILHQNMRPENERSLYTWYLNNANIICATLSSSVNLLQYVNYFDICIIDEATQCTEPWTLLPLKFGINSLVLVGDTQQLPATVLSKKANELGLGTSLFTRIQHCLDNIPCTSAKGSGSVTTPNNIICGLQTQYRMHPEICKWPNQYFYRNELINSKTTMTYKSPIAPFSILNLAYTQNASSGNGNFTNNLEAEFVAKLLKALDGFIPNKYNSYGVITPYAQHRTILESSIRSLGLTNIMVNTIDSYQGLEKDVIIISNARTNGIGFLSNPQRLNVALTRPKKCLILCGNFKNLETVPAWRCLLENARERKLYHEISTNCVSDMQTNVIDKIRIQK